MRKPTICTHDKDRIVHALLLSSLLLPRFAPVHRHGKTLLCNSDLWGDSSDVIRCAAKKTGAKPKHTSTEYI